MFDAITGERLIVQESEFGPFIAMHSYENFDFLDDLFTEQHDVQTGRRSPPAGDPYYGQHLLYFDTAADVATLQAIVDAASYQCADSGGTRDGTPKA